ncbi:MAG: flagellar biosynthesis regulator FlaF [Pseudomonadota bacterium]
MYDGTPSMDGYGAEAGYAAVTKTIDTGRGGEAKIVARIISMLAAGSKKAAEGDIRPLAEALHKNNELWTILAIDVAQKGNGLPADLRARIVYLMEFTHQHSRKVLNREADVAPLININKAIMRGLMGQSETPQTVVAPSEGA